MYQRFLPEIQVSRFDKTKFHMFRRKCGRKSSDHQGVEDKRISFVENGVNNLQFIETLKSNYATPTSYRNIHATTSKDTIYYYK